MIFKNLFSLSKTIFSRNFLLFVAVLLAGMIATPSTASAAVLFYDGFESGNLSHVENGIQWNGGTAVTVDTSRSRTGNYSLKYTYNNDASGDAQAEQRFYIGPKSEIWIKWYVYYPSNYAIRSEENNKFIIFWKDTYSSNYIDIEQWRCSLALGDEACPNSTSGYGPLHLKYEGVDRGHHHPFDTHLNGTYGREPDPVTIFNSATDINRWVEYIIHWKMPTSASSNNGVVELWKDGTKQMEYLNLDNYDSAGSGPVMTDGYFLGWANTGFNNTPVLMHIDDVTFSSSSLLDSGNPTVLFQDNFNYTDSFDNHGWSAGPTSSIAPSAGPDGSNALKITYNCDSNNCGDRWHNWDAPANTQELDVKFNFKFDCGSGSCVGGTKFLKLFGIRNGTNYANTTTATTYQTNIFDQLSYGCSGITRDTASIVTYGGSSSCGGTVTGTKPGPINAMDGQWHTWELHMKYNDNSQTNAIYEVWYDSVKIIGLTGVTNRDNTNSLYFDYISLGGWNQFYGGVPYSVYYDNVVISSTPTGSTPDTAPPTSPTNLAASSPSQSSVTVSWNPATDNVGVANYIVERCQGSGCSNFAQVGTPTASPFVDTGLTPNTVYNYHVRAADAAGNLSGWSNVVGATTQAPDTAPPTAPSSLSASVVSFSNINLTWTASTDNVGVTGYKLERCTGSNCSTFTEVGTPTATNYSDTGLSASTLYRYRVRATDAAGNNSNYSSITEGTTPVAPPVSQSLLLGLNFNEGSGTTSADVSGRNHTGTLSNTTWTTGRNGNGVSFSGNANSYVAIPNESDFDLTNNFTVSLWMKTASFGSAWASLVSKGDSSWSLTRYNTTSTLDFNTFSPSANDLQGTANVMNDAWHHVAIAYDGATKKIYVDGNVDAQASFTQTLSTNNFPVRIGGNAEYAAGAFNGSVDDIRIYNKALTQSEIQTDMNTPLTQSTSAASCNTVTTANFSDAGYNSYGAPYDAFQTSTNLLDAKCNSADTHTINLTTGITGDTTRIVYTKGYWYDSVTAGWRQYTGTCTGALNGEWCQGSVSATITDANVSTASSTNPTYLVGMTCSVQGGSWKCGCRDTSCMNFSWQIQGAGL